MINNIFLSFSILYLSFSEIIASINLVNYVIFND